MVSEEKDMYIYISNPGGKMTHYCVMNEVKIKEKPVILACCSVFLCFDYLRLAEFYFD